MSNILFNILIENELAIIGVHTENDIWITGNSDDKINFEFCELKFTYSKVTNELKEITNEKNR